eukprot:CAMPEP_0176044492 /NCGR_PEP_ID=MMETSP0120_2-20121206/22082_1 /TAXON_ID=160619 /ORGANISM="Kryptoperidinium foliaceum, Strain CCMP 1326" /LENGTH=362 /DNA_ID=CAMNT_0017377897 /DNA_START=121 /DNA_END=1205 /DNA_ORIENTATION=-
MSIRQNRGSLCGGVAKMQHLEADDLPSTAASSVMQSPSSGPEAPPPAGYQLDEKLLGHALSDLYDIAEVAEQDVERVRKSELQRACEWYFSIENLSHDRVLRSLMDEQGWVALGSFVDLAMLHVLGAMPSEVAVALAPLDSVEVCADGLRVRHANPAVRAAFGNQLVAEKDDGFVPEVDVADEALTIAASLTQPSPPREPFAPEVDLADEDLTIAASIDHLARPVQRASKEGAPWPCVEWLTAEPCVEAPLLEWLLSGGDLGSKAQRPARRRRRHGAALRGRGGGNFQASFDSEVASSIEDLSSAAAWMRASDDGYAAPRLMHDAVVSLAVSAASCAPGAHGPQAARAQAGCWTSVPHGARF